MVRQQDHWVCIDYKEFPYEACTSKNRLMVMVLHSSKSSYKGAKIVKPKILWKILKACGK